MTSILISVKPKYAFMMMSGEKQYEFRTIKPKKSIDKIILYVMAPYKFIIGEIEVKQILSGIPSELWQSLTLNVGIKKENYDKYFENKKIAYAYELGNIKKYKEPKLLMDFGIKYPTQSYIYVEE